MLHIIPPSFLDMSSGRFLIISTLFEKRPGNERFLTNRLSNFYANGIKTLLYGDFLLWNCYKEYSQKSSVGFCVVIETAGIKSVLNNETGE